MTLTHSLSGAGPFRPRWVINNSTTGGPLDVPALSAKYISTWVLGAKQAHNLTIDWVGLWNEHWEATPVMFAYAKELRAQLDAAGLQATKIIGPDAFTAAAETLCTGMVSDPVLRAAVGAIGVHGAIPGPGSACQQLGEGGLPLFSSEDGSTYGDTAGALLRVETSNAEYISSGSQGGNFWNPFGGYYPGIPFWGHSLLACHHPWSGHYTVRSTIWAGAHMCQHTQPGMSFVNSNATGALASGCGNMVTTVSPDGDDFTTIIGRAGLTTPQAPGNPRGCPAETATFTLAGRLATTATSVAVWLTQMDADGHPLKEFERQLADLPVRGGAFVASLPPNSIVTLTSLTKLGRKGAHPDPPAPAPFPFPYAEDFDSYPHEGSNIARYFSDMSGAFEVIPDPTTASAGGVLRQVTPIIPIGWYSLTADTLPYTQIGSFDWANYTVTASVHLPPAGSPAVGWVGARLGGNPECDGPAPICSNPWGLFAVLDNRQSPGAVRRGWQLRLHQRVKDIDSESTALFNATVAPARADATGGWARVELTVQGVLATVRVDGKLVASRVDVTGPLTAPGTTKSYLPRAGWAGLGGGRGYSTELYFDNFTVTSAAGPAASSGVSYCAPSLRAGMPLIGVPCGLDLPGLAWDLKPATAAAANRTAAVIISPRAAPALCAAGVGSGLQLLPCNGSDVAQQFLHPRGVATISSISGSAPGKSVSPWQTFTPGEGVRYGAGFGAGQKVTATRHLPQHQEKETIEFAVDGASQGLLTMPLGLPEDVVGCVGVCNINSLSAVTVTAVAPATFVAGAVSHGAAVVVSPDGKTATWPASSGCNQIAVLDPNSASVADPAFSVELSSAPNTSRASTARPFVDVGWCSRSLDPTGKGWKLPPGPSPAGWMGEQGDGLDWIFRSAGQFKASTDGPGGSSPAVGRSWCLPDSDSINRGTVRPWEPAVTSASCGPGGQVAWDTEFGYLWTGADTTGMCFGVCV